MKRGMTLLALVFTLLLGAQAVCASPVPAVYSVTVAFDANGGMGVMPSLAVASNVQTKLPANVFTRENGTFGGWNTQADGKGTAYADQADVTALATAAANGTRITLYAQWIMSAPSIKSLSSKKPGTLTVTVNGSDSSNYSIQYSLYKNFKKASTADVPDGETSMLLDNLTPGKNYYVRACVRAGTSGGYGEWGASSKKKVKKGWTIVNVKAAAAIEADITLSGAGTGYHAKLVIGGGTVDAAVSYGIQYDQFAAAPYTGKAMALIENIASNAPGGQSYVRPGSHVLTPGKTYRMMAAIDKAGNGAVYLDYKLIGTFKNPALAKQNVYLRIEGCARKNGDSVNAVFQNIKLRKGKKYDPERKWGISGYGSYNKGLKIKEDKKTDTFTFSGTITGLPANGDWDNCYESVSALVQVQ